MEFVENLYFGTKALTNGRKVIRKLKKGKYLPGVCVISFSNNTGNLMDITEAYKISRHEDTSGMVVIGVAYGKDEALELVRQIIDDTYTEFGAVNNKNLRELVK